ncbi:cystatin-like [Tiliqua scincoides]|uniref:cystatin-like n=1 Tax=Tiliqua scincoides TaxID=71010 RepID=UPI0034636284
MALARGLMLCSVLLVSAAVATAQRRLGAPAIVAENDEGVQRALQFAINEYNRASNDKYSSRLAEVITVQKQLVSGIKYILDVKIGRTTCPKSTMDVEGCAFLETAEKATCHFEVHSIPWLNQIHLLQNNCQQ